MIDKDGTLYGGADDVIDMTKGEVVGYIPSEGYLERLRAKKAKKIPDNYSVIGSFKRYYSTTQREVDAATPFYRPILLALDNAEHACGLLRNIGNNEEPTEKEAILLKIADGALASAYFMLHNEVIQYLDARLKKPR